MENKEIMSVELPSCVLTQKFCCGIIQKELSRKGNAKTEKFQATHAFKFMETPEINDKPQPFPKSCFGSLMIVDGIFWWGLAPVPPAICSLTQGDVRTGAICG